MEVVISMRKINFEEYNKKRKEAKIELLKLRDELNIKSGSGGTYRSSEKRDLLFKLAKRKKEKMLEKVGPRKYKMK